MGASGLGARRLAWPLRKDDTHKSRNGPSCPPRHGMHVCIYVSTHYAGSPSLGVGLALRTKREARYYRGRVAQSLSCHVTATSSVRHARLSTARQAVSALQKLG